MYKKLESFKQLWNRWLSMSVNRRIFGAMVIVGILTFTVKLAAVLKELVVAYKYGTSDEMDAFLIALMLPLFGTNVIAGSLNSAFIPTFIHVREHEGKESAQRLFSNVMVWSTLVLILITVLMAIIVPYLLPLIASGFDTHKLSLARSFFYILLPMLVLSGLTTNWAAVLNAGERFGLPAIVPIITPTITVLIVLTLSKSWGIYSLVIGTVFGYLLEAILLAWGLKKHGFSLSFRWYGIDSDTKKVINQYIPMVAGAFLMSGTVIVDQSMAAILGPGSVSALNYGNKVVSFILALGAFTISTVVFPHFSRMVALSDWRYLKHTIKTYALLILIISVPLTLSLILFSEPLVKLLFERGAFTSNDTYLVGKVQALYLLQLPFYLLGVMGVRLLSALAKNNVLMVISGINLVINILGNYILMRIFGVAGISLSTSIVYIISAVLIYISICKNLKLRGKLDGQ